MGSYRCNEREGFTVIRETPWLKNLPCYKLYFVVSDFILHEKKKASPEKRNPGLMIQKRHEAVQTYTMMFMPHCKCKLHVHTQDNVQEIPAK